MLIVLGVLFLSPCLAHEGTDHKAQELAVKRVESLLRVKSKVSPPPSGVTDIKFKEFFKMPIGPRGLEPTEKLLSLNGKRVRIFGYMVNAEEPSPGPFILAPLAVSMAEKEDGPADDMPASTVFVHLQKGEDWVVPHVSGLLKLIGILQVGSQEEADGRVSAVRLMLEEDLSRSLLGKTAGHSRKKSS
ncbi:MAG: hypothetical protein PHE55_03865 [Methylococcaceae bacterium]|nr:hypothetical protein [Methylococcaceae bacterium]